MLDFRDAVQSEGLYGKEDGDDGKDHYRGAMTARDDHVDFILAGSRRCVRAVLSILPFQLLSWDPFPEATTDGPSVDASTTTNAMDGLNRVKCQPASIWSPVP